jgi:hypothetical protein
VRSPERHLIALPLAGLKFAHDFHWAVFSFETVLSLLYIYPYIASGREDLFSKPGPSDVDQTCTLLACYLDTQMRTC